MKKLFTLIAFLAVVMGAKAEWVQIHKVDYSQFTGFPAYVMGYVPEWVNGVMTDIGGAYRHATDSELEGDAALKDGEEIVGTVNKHDGTVYNKIAVPGGTWHQYFITNGNFATELDGAYTLKAYVRASEPVSVPVQMRWSWGEDPASSTLNITTEWQEVECDFTGINGTACDLIAQPNTTATIEWQYIEVWQNKKQSRPVEWLEQLTNGNAETAWTEAEASTKFNDQENNFKICAWAKEKGTNVGEDGGSNPHPAEIITEENGNHAFIVRGAVADTEGDPSAWDNQFWIQSPKSWKEGTQIKIHFRYKASQPAHADTQIHKQNPSDYLHWQAVGEVSFTEDWQDFDQTFTFNKDMNSGWSIAFNLNKDNKNAVNFYFDDLSWQIMKLDEGFFVASSDVANGIAYDYDNATELVYDEADDAYVAVVGEMGKKNTWVSELQISTQRGQDAAFKSSTIKPAYVKNDAEDWAGFTAATNYKIKLPAAGVWKISIADVKEDGTGLINFIKLEGDEEKEPVVIVANPYEVVINAVERDWKASGEEGVGEGQPWDNQFCIMANRPLMSGEETVISFDYVAEKAATTNTQVTSDVPGGYLFWNCIGDVNFTTEEQHLEKTYKIPFGDNSTELTTQSITFNMAVIREANVYKLKNIIWKTADDSESLIDMEGTKNFLIKTGANTGFYEAGTDGIQEITTDKAKSNAVYNIAGQRVSNTFKGVAIKNGQKYIVK